MVSVNIKTREVPSSGASDFQGWCPPQQGFLKVNVDAAFLAGRAASAMVVHNDQGNLLYLASKLYECISPFTAEVEALGWAIEYADQCGWRRVEWETDAKEEWKVNWRSRRCNMVANAGAMLSLSTEWPFVFDEFNVNLIPPCILNSLLAEQAVAAV
ncbi:hypothetical protein FNV43_RR06292 [Rhamnella rubrinervis]|uniref:RNase H type-1 domain-containing protein n=1 Tax=Rhamnella rubrinervis TaxID=2594499 RepID=A0A8K0HCP6_9ROSA|nr:hypothetical protein FNV43_RR06292 [Rhamnella rubrinervis]